MAKPDPAARHPTWWNDSHKSAWELVREAFRQSFHGESQSQPAKVSFNEVEPALRLGYAARRHFEDEWDPALEARLENEWDTLHDDGSSEEPSKVWDEVRPFVHRGWLGP